MLMYFVTLDSSSQGLVRLQMTPLKIRRFRLNRVCRDDAKWLRESLSAECGKLGPRVTLNPDNTLLLGWL